MNKKINLIDFLEELKNTISKAITKQTSSNLSSNVSKLWQQATAWEEVVNYLTGLIKKYHDSKDAQKELFLANALISLDKYLDFYSLDEALINEKNKIQKLLKNIVNKSLLIIQRNKIKISPRACGNHEDGACEIRSHSTRIIKSLGNLPIHAAVTFRKNYILQVKIRKIPYIKIIRIIGKNNSPYGSYWLLGINPNSRKKWRSRYAVLEAWNKGTHYVELDLKKHINCWVGLAASQQIPFKECILYGGLFQVWISPQTINILKMNNQITQVRPTG